MFRTIITTVALGLAVCACSTQGEVKNPRVGQGVVSPSLNSGVTSLNGGGARALGVNPGITLGTSGAPEVPPPHSRGASY